MQGDSPLAPKPTSPEELFELAYRGCGTALLGYALRRCATREDAFDVVAETFLVAWRRRDQLPTDPEEALPWLFTCARWVLANHSRGERRAEHLGRRLAEELGGLQDAPDPTHAIETRTRSELVRAALAELSPSDRELITLTAWDGLLPAQAGAVLGLSPGTSRVRLHRARARLRTALSTIRPTAKDIRDDH